jgi:hypothetical protein
MDISRLATGGLLARLFPPALEVLQERDVDEAAAVGRLPFTSQLGQIGVCLEMQARNDQRLGRSFSKLVTIFGNSPCVGLDRIKQIEDSDAEDSDSGERQCHP